ncbi:hypothetical protein [Bacillus sp. B-jedd]|uniref:hypothetical protein n=1 Tax=Bacillus sp. B-jedd TaxID=1476857 RepID=UPI000515626B|nr:hypothetical protein [Bacillus sp. B-jedd]CEG26235.1 hypothetical protein BN1002_01077 [Bacillus sp. B-jedd]
MKKRFIVLAVILAIYIVLHSTPNAAIRTNIFMIGHPVIAFKTGIVDYEFRNEKDKVLFLDELGGKAYTLTKPPFDTATQTELRSYGQVGATEEAGRSLFLK